MSGEAAKIMMASSSLSSDAEQSGHRQQHQQRFIRRVRSPTQRMSCGPFRVRTDVDEKGGGGGAGLSVSRRWRSLPEMEVISPGGGAREISESVGGGGGCRVVKRDEDVQVFGNNDVIGGRCEGDSHQEGQRFQNQQQQQQQQNFTTSSTPSSPTSLYFSSTRYPQQPYSSHQHHHHTKQPKILKKTWDKVKTIIHHSSTSPGGGGGGSARRESLSSSGGGGGKTQTLPSSSSCAQTPCSSSAPSSPLFEEFSGSSGGGDGVGAGIGGGVGDERERIARNYALLQKRLSDEFHRMTEQDECGGGGGAGVSGGLSLSAVSTATTPPGVPGRVASHITDEFRERLRQWEMWKASTGKGKFTEEEIREIIGDQEFGRKLVEWEVMRAASTSGEHHHHYQQSGSTASSATASSSSKPRKRDRINSNNSTNSASSSNNNNTNVESELAWLDKQLEKIEVEKKRLEAEMNKYLEREARLEKMKQALSVCSKIPPHGSVYYVQTPTACVRVEKITEKFAKKLYEWEEKRGIGVEHSGFGLLSDRECFAAAAAAAAGGEEDNKNSAAAAMAMEGKGGRGSDEDDGGGAPSRSRDERVVVVNKSGSVEGLGKEIGGDFEVEDDEEEVEGPLDRINRRLREKEKEGETEQEKNVRLAIQHVAEALASVEELELEGKGGGGTERVEPDGRVSSTASSLCSGDFEYDDSFATKNTSGASNTDSDVFLTGHKLRVGGGHHPRRSSDAVSTPGRSPSLSAFTSEDEEEVDHHLIHHHRGGGGGVEEMEEEEEEEILIPLDPLNEAAVTTSTSAIQQKRWLGVGATAAAAATTNSSSSGYAARDAESQTDVIVKAKQIVVYDDDEEVESGGCGDRGLDGGRPGIFVQTKRTIFSPIIDDCESVGGIEKEEEEEDDGGGGVKAAVGKDYNVDAITTTILPPVQQWSSDEESDREGNVEVVVAGDEDEFKPRVVGAIPKSRVGGGGEGEARSLQQGFPGGGGVPLNSSPEHQQHQQQMNNASSYQYKPQPKTQFQRSFPKMGKIPVWCSPLVSRRGVRGCDDEEVAASASGSSVPGLPAVSISTADFISIDRFLEAACGQGTGEFGGGEMNLLRSGSYSCSSSSTGGGSGRPAGLPVMPRTNVHVPRKYTIGGGFAPERGMMGGEGGGGGGGVLLTRSNSFGFGNKDSSQQQQQREAAGEGQQMMRDPGLFSSGAGAYNFAFDGGGRDNRDHHHHHHDERYLMSSASSMNSVSKSKSTGSIKSRLGRAFGRKGAGGGGIFGFGKGRTQQQQQQQQGGGGGGGYGSEEEVGSMAGCVGGIQQGQQPYQPAAAAAAFDNDGGEGIPRRGSGGGSGNNNRGTTPGGAGFNPIRRFGSWVYNFGGGSGGAAGGAGGGGGGA